jgi:hypothetical protein
MLTEYCSIREETKKSMQGVWPRYGPIVKAMNAPCPGHGVVKSLKTAFRDIHVSTFSMLMIKFLQSYACN